MFSMLTLGSLIHSLVNTEQPYIHTRWSIFTFPGQNEPRPGHGTPWVNSGTIPAIPGRLATLVRVNSVTETNYQDRKIIRVN